MERNVKESSAIPPGERTPATKRSWILLFSVFVLVVVLGGFVYYRSEAARIQEEKAQDLAVIGKTKVEQIERWRKERAYDVFRIAGSAVTIHVLQEWLRRPEDAGSKASLTDQLRIETDLGLYFQALLGDVGENVLLSFPETVEMETDSWAAVKKAWSSFAPVISELHYTVSGKIHLDIAMAARDKSGQALTVVVVTTDAKEFLFPMIRAWPTSSRTAETLLVRREGNEALFLNDVRHKKDTALALSIPLSRIEVPAVQAALGRTGTFLGKDYRGVAVLADLRPVPGTSWYLVSKEDTAEILAEVRYRAVVVSVIVAMLLLGVAGLIGYVYRIQILEDRRRVAENFVLLSQKNELILNSAAEGILGLNLEGNHTFANPAAAKMLGYELEELLGRPSHSLWHHTKSDGSPYPREKCQIYAAYRDGRVYRSSSEVFWRRDGTSFPVEYTSTPIYERGRLAGAVVVFDDITERKRMEKELEQAKETQFRVLLETLPAKAFLKDRNSVYLFCNANFAKDLKLKPEEIAGKTDYDLFSTDVAEKNREEDKRIMGSRKTESREEEYQVIGDYLAGISKSYIRSVKAPIYDKKGNATGLLGLFWDITEQKELKEEKARVEVLASAAATKTKFASTVSHELRSPLAVIVGALDIVLDGLTGHVNDELKDVLGIAKRNCDRLSRLINNVLDFQKLETGRMAYDLRENDLHEVVADVHGSMNVLAKGKGLDFKLELTGDLPRLKFDRDKVIQVLTNLVSNAIYHTERGSVTLVAQKENDVAHLRVRDTGCGIPTDEIPRIFQPFEQVGGRGSKEKGGTGLGLAISREIIFAHRGKIWAESEVGKGSTFHVTLPL